MLSTRLFFILNLLHFSYQLENQSISEVTWKIDHFIENLFLPYSGVEGLGLAIVQNNGDFVYTTGYGFADREKKIPNGNQTQFLLGSVTKTFTAMVVAKTLHESFPELGEAVLDIPIRQLVPQSKFILNDSIRSEYATFRDLLSHKMCIPRDDFQMMTQPFDTKEEILYRQRYAKDSCGFRSRFMYNNHMVLWASELIGYLNGQTFEQNAKELLQEIGMLHSAFISSTDDFSGLRAKPYYVMNKRMFPMNPELIKRLSNLEAIGGLYVTPNDMARFLQFQLNLGNIDGKQVIAEQVMSWLTKPSSLYPKFKFKVKNNEGLIESPLAYGLGVMIGSYDGWQRISHSGYFTPYRSEISWYPELNLGIFSSTHEAPTNVKQHVLHGFIFETLLGKENASQRAVQLMEEQRAKAEQEEKGKSITLENFLGHYKNQVTLNEDDFWYDLIGEYKNKVSGQVEIFQKYNLSTKRLVLYLSYGKWGKGWLVNVGGEAYQIVWDTDLSQDYNAAGDANGFVIIKKDGSLNFVRPTTHGMITYAQFVKET